MRKTNKFTAWLLAPLTRVSGLISRGYAHHPRITVGLFAVAAIAGGCGAWQLSQPRGNYDLASARTLLPAITQSVGSAMKYDAKKHQYTYDSSVMKTASAIQTNGVGGVSIAASKKASDGVTVSDTTASVNLKMTPTYGLFPAEQQDNRIIYPMTDNTGWTVYTLSKAGTKEDIVLDTKTTDSRTFTFDLGLGDNLVAKIESDGSIGVYGNSLLSGNVTTGSASDSALLDKARKNAPKTTLMFTIPKPIVYEKNNKQSSASAVYALSGDKLSVIVSNLSHATFPVTVDPSIYVVTAQQFMDGNNETNINFDVANKLIDKTPTTGARFNSWNSTTNLPTPTWGGGSVATGGFIYQVGGTSLNGQVYNTQGSASLTIPTGVTSITVKGWGAGGGGGAGDTSTGGAGGAGGYLNETIAVTPGETLDVYIGGGGTGGSYNTTRGAGEGGSGGGYTSLYRGSTLLAIIAGGGGGGGGNGNNVGGAGGAGGGTSGVGGSASGAAGGGGAGTASAGGSGGTGGNNPGTAGTSLSGGDGADGRTGSGTDGSGAVGGLATGGNGGASQSNSRAAAGGGGAGYFGGGGGSGSTASTAAGGGGGGSTISATGATSVTNTAGSGATPANSTDTTRNGSGTGGTAGAAASAGGNGADGIMVIGFGSGGTAVSQSVSWAQFDTSTGVINSANPGSGTCNGWCTTSAYNLPSARSNFSLVTYNGFLYALGGTDSGGTGQKTVYIAKLGANGEPQLWSPTSTDKTTWTYWYSDTALTSTATVFSAVAYNNRMYIVAGRSGTTVLSTVLVANINPQGTLGSFATTTALPTALYGGDVQVYNDRIYYIGGAPSVGGTPGTSVYYSKINTDGTLNSWVATSNFSNGRITGGGSFTATWGAYIYLSGGCQTMNASGYCTSVASDTQLASINADGSLSEWNSIGGATNQIFGTNLIAWRNNVYEVGGCVTQNATSGACDLTSSNISYGTINPEGDASTVAQSVAAGTAPCSGATPTNCNQPGTSYIGNMLSAAVITNGYLYVIGGCTNNTCSTTSANVTYTAITATGTLQKPAACSDGVYQGNAWCTDTTNIITGGIAAASPVVFNNRIYLVGGLNGTNNTNTIVRTDVATDGSINAWTSQSMTGVGAANVSYLYAYARANPSSAATNPGNLYIFGGCATSSAAGCTAYSSGVYKCNIQTAGAIAGCTTTGQLQIGIIPGDTAAGLGIMSGAVYANYVYLIGGVSPNLVDLATVRYAKIDSNNNIVAVSGSAWTESPNQMATGRRRAAAFGYNGYLYAVGGYDGTSGNVLADIEFIKINVSDGSLGSATDGFHVSSVTINQRWGLSVPVSNSYAYVIGGCVDGASPSNCTTRTDVIQTFQIYNNNDGAPAGYSTANTYGTNPSRYGASSTVLNGYIYEAGGCTSTTDCTTAINNVSYAAINADGTLGTWAAATNVLPAVRTWGNLQSAGGSLYYIGGQSSTATDYRSEVYYATPATNGNITSAWGTATNGLPQSRSQFGATVWNNRLYVVGGKSTTANCSTGVCNTVYVSPQLTSGGNITSAWSTSSTSFNIPRSGLTAVAYANNLYVLGGFDGTNYLSDTQFSQISTTNGTAGSWTYSESLPSPTANADGFAANGYIYLVGGRSNATTCTPNTFVAPISANTTIASGNLPTGIGAWFSTNQRYTGNRYGNNVSYSNGRLYVMGGACGTAGALTFPGTATQQTSLRSQPQVAKYSIAIDTDTDVFPTKWLINGLDNSIGASWQLKYRSMTNLTTSCTSPAMTTWGQETNVGNVTLGLPGTYTPLNASGTNTNCARFYYMNLTVDSSQAFGYPDDVSRGPTISDITLQFTADPSKRLSHGRTFTGGLQQPDDTPYYSQ